MIADGRGFLATAWWMSLFPGLAMLLTVLAVNLMGDWLRDHLDPRLRQVGPQVELLGPAVTQPESIRPGASLLPAASREGEIYETRSKPRRFVAPPLEPGGAGGGGRRRGPAA